MSLHFFSTSEFLRRPKGLLAVLTLVLAIAGARPGQADDAFFAGSEGVPIMPGYEEQPDMGVIFDKPEGRIVEGYAAGPATADEIQGFYRETLPQLGWVRVGEGLYRREGEILRIEVLGAAEEGRNILRIVLAPLAEEPGSPGQ